jgi:two-component system sensor histidine kinase DesK
MIGFALVAVTYVQAAHTSLWMSGAALALLLALFGLQFTHSFPHRLPRLAAHRKLTLALQAIITFLPFAVFGQAWLGMPGFLCASCLLILPPALGWACVGAVVACTETVYLITAHNPGQAAYLAVGTVLTALTVYGMSQLAELVREVHHSRADLARMAVDQERLRFARDLHDLLGYSLSTIILKCELAHRLIPQQPERSQHELAEILQTARQALGDVRAIASSYRELSLSAEVASAQSILATVGIPAVVTVQQGAISGPNETVLAIVLREAITNILRHSKAQQCTIEAARDGDAIRMRIANDGLDQHPAKEQQGPAGSGLDNLRHRVAALGGRLTAGHRTDGWFELTAVVPLAGQHTAAGPARPGH